MEEQAAAGLIQTAAGGLTPLEILEGERARRLTVEHIGVRRVLNMDELAQLRDERPRLEKEIKLPGDKRGSKNRVYMFSIDGWLNGERLTGCLFAGQCMMIQAEGFEKANKLARDGLRATLEIAKEYWDELQRSQLVVADGPLDTQHMTVEVGGRRGAPFAQAAELGTDPKLRRMIESIIGGKPWAG